MATLEKTWQSMMNLTITPVDNLDLSRQLLWNIKAFLKGEVGGATQGLWTHYASSDSVTAGIDATDRWLAAYDGTKIVRAAAGVAHSWIVLKSPSLAGYNWYLIIDFVGTTNYAARFVWCRTAPTGGSITARPTSTDEFATVKTSPTPGTIQLNDLSTITPHYIHAGLATDGCFWLAEVKQGSGLVCFAMISSLLDTTGIDARYPFYGYAAYNATANYGAAHPSTFGNPSSNATSGGSGCMRHPDGASSTITAATGCPCLTTGDASGAAYWFGPYATAWVTTGITPGYDPWNARYMDFPVYLASVSFVGSSLTTIAFRGRLPDFAWGAANQGTVDPISGSSYTSTMIGNLWMPCTGSTVPLF